MEELDRIREYFEGRADASCEPGDDRFRGNEEMSLLRDVEAVASYISDGAKWIPASERELPPAIQILRNQCEYAASSAEAVELMCADAQRLLAYIAEISRDAERYRHLRANWDDFTGTTARDPGPWLDTTIDAVLSAGRPK